MGECVQAATPSTDTTWGAGALLSGSAGRRHVAAHAERSLDLVERGVAVGADVGGEEAVEAVAALAGQDQDAPERPVEIAVPPAVRRHAALAAWTRDGRDRRPWPGIGVAEEGWQG